MWTIRTEKGKTFGPATREALRSWAHDGRIAPTSEASQNGADWVPVTSIGLDMDWIAEVSPATFYGPIHRNAIDELLREGSLTPAASLYKRENLEAQDVSLLLADLQDESAAHRQSAARAAALEQQLAALQRSFDNNQAELKARDHEFDAERQELKAVQNRMHAEMIKKDGRLTTLATEHARLESTATEAAALQSRFAEYEKLLAQARHTAESNQQQAELLRKKLIHAEQECSSLRTQAERESHELETSRKQLTAQSVMIENVRRIAQQFSTALANIDQSDAEDAEIVVGPVDVPPISPPTGKKTAATFSLADLEVQAQHELKTIRENGGTIFKRQKKQ